MEYVQFKITAVEYGWIFAEIETETKQVQLVNSYLGGLQMPKVFLQAIIELLNVKEHEQWICWHGESNSYIWCMTVKDESLELCIYEGGCSFELPLEGSPLKRYAQSSRILFKTNTLLYPFALSVRDTLKFYHYGQGYEIWQRSQYKDMFPETEYAQLRKILRKSC